MNLALLANGPGEVWGWSRPFILTAAQKGWSIDVHLLPCPYASGCEFDAISRLPASVSRHLSAFSAFKAFAKARPYDAVLQLGGDLMFGRFLAWRQKIPLACYSYGKKKGMERCDVVMTSREGLFSAERLEIVGDLVLDSLDLGTPGDWSAPAGKRIVVFPGSRPLIRDKAFYMLNDIRKRIMEILPDAEIRVLLSPFASDDEIPKWTDAGFHVWRGTTPAGIKGADLALTQPGTNNLELMYCRQPFAVTIPFSFIRQMPLSGLIGMLDKVPFFGAAARERYVRTRLPRYIGKTAWPNRLTDVPFVPELIGEYSPEALADEVIGILSDVKGLESQKKGLEELAVKVEPGAPQRICDSLERMVVGYGR